MAVFSGLTVNTNVPALTAQTNLQRSSALLNTSLERLSTGLRINSSADDPSGLVISEFQRAQIAGLSKSISNVDRAISLVQTAEGGLAEISSLMIELRSLVTDSANNGALDIPSLEANQANVENILNTIDRIANTTQFGTFNLLNGDSGLTGFTTSANVRFLAATDPSLAAFDTNAPQAVVVTAAAQRAFTSNQAAGISGAQQLAAAETLIVNGVEVSLDAGLNTSQVVERINEFTGASGVVAFENAANAGRITLRTVQFGSSASVNVVSTQAAVAGQTGLTSAVSDAAGVDIAGTIGGAAATGHGNVLTGDPGSTAAGVSIEIGTAGSQTTTVTGAQGDIVLVNNSRTFQIGAFSDPINRSTITLFKADTEALGINRDRSTTNAARDNQFDHLRDIDVRSVDGANDALRLIEQAIGEIANQRGAIGAFQKNTLESTQSNLRTQLVNLQDAESSLRDTDFTTEITRFTSEQIRQQASTTVLGLANQSALAILGLLQGGQ
ncbi:MAG: hypothetical protein KY476_06670 [Planctomycetes bacterium]|nr:hypothetical protein [Planctomycetota bacterium]